MRNPWVLAQFTVAAVLLVISLVGIIGTTVFDAPELAFSFQGGIQAFAVFPGLVLSLTLNGILMGLKRAPEPNTAQKVLLGIEFLLVAALIVFHFYNDPAGNNFGLAIIVWPIVILVAVAIVIVAITRLAIGRQAAQTAQPVPPPPVA